MTESTIEANKRFFASEEEVPKQAYTMGIKNIMQAKKILVIVSGADYFIIYVALVVTFGFTLLVTDVAIMIMTYYSVIGGWITEYLAVYLAGQGVYAAEEGYFTSFITSEVYPIIFMLLFLAITAFIVYSGVEKGIERFARIVMPGLLIMIVGIAVYSLTLHFKDGNGSIRTGI